MLPFYVFVRFQAPSDTLEAFLAASKLNNPVVVAPESVRPVSKATGLASYGRKLVRLGSIDAIVPTTIVSFDDSLSRPPNLYDGLPREAKVLYLISTLTPAQRRLAGGKGVGLDDLQGEQRDVFNSLLPKNFKWRKSQIGQDGKPKDLATGELTGEKISKLRLQLVQSVQFTFHLIADSLATNGTNTSADEGEPGDILVTRDSEDEEEQGSSLYGVSIRRTIENRPKPSELQTSAIEKTIPILPGDTIGILLTRIGREAGREILADLRVRDLTVAGPKLPMRGGDLLESLALAIGGTYRKVGPAYLLTSDLTGAGVRQARLGAWRGAVERSIRQREDAWRKSFAASGGLKTIDFAPGDPLMATGALAEHLDKEKKMNSTYPVEGKMLSPALQSFLHHFVTRHTGLHWDTDHLAADRSYTFRFILPDGTPVRPGGNGLGTQYRFTSRPPSEPASDPASPVVPIAIPPESSTFPVLFKTEDPAEAGRAAVEARDHGIREVGLETHRPEALAAALRSGISVKLVVRPWSGASPGHPDADLTLLGDDGSALAKHLIQDEMWFDYDGRPLVSLAPISPLLSPETSSAKTQLDRLSELARTPGLQGVILLDTQPHGYEPVRSGSIYSDFPGPLVMETSFGYTETARLSFLRTNGVDPIDLGWEGAAGTIDLQPSFFPDSQLRSWRQQGNPVAEPAALHPLLNKWDRYRHVVNRSALSRLLAALPSIPIEIQGRSGDADALPDNPPVLLEWKPGDELPILPEGIPTGAPTERTIAIISPNGKLYDAWSVVHQALNSPNSGNRIPALDLTRIPPKAWTVLLDRTFRRIPIPKN